MASTIVTKNSSTASAVPVTGDLTQGELAVNVTDKKLYTKDSGGTVVKLVGGLGNQEANAVAITGGSINGTTVGATTASTGAFTTLSASSTVSGTGFSTYLASPPAIGGTAAAAGSFTTLSASSTTTLSGGTANGVAYLNGSKVVTTGSALVFDGTNLGIGTSSPGATLHVAGSSGSVLIQPTNVASALLNMRHGSIAANNYFRVDSNSSTVFGTSGSDKATLDASGNLGIGTSSPGYKLTVSGGATSLAANQYMRFGSQIFAAGDGSATNYLFSGPTSMTWRNAADSADLMYLSNSGNLGLGVTPSAWSGLKAFEIAGTGSSLASAANNNLFLSANAWYNGTNWRYGTTAEASQYQSFAGAHRWFTAPSGTAGNAISFTQAMTLDASGNLGVGTTSPSGYRLRLNSTDRALYVTTAGATAALPAVYLSDSTHSVDGVFTPESGQLRFGSYTSHPVVFVAGNTERARIDSSGNLGVGVTSPAARLDIYSPSTTAATPIAYMGKALNDSTTSNVLVQFLINSGGTGSGQINANGASAAAFGTYSDERLKENIETLDSQLSNVCSLRPVEFDYKDGSGHQIGFIAQEMQNVYPDCIGEDSEGMLTITGWSKTEARLVKALQEMKAIIDEQAARIAALEAK